MKTDTLRQYVSLRDALEREKSELESRLDEINSALGTAAEQTGPKSATPQKLSSSAAAPKGPLRSAARAHIAAAQRARWIAFRKAKGGTASSPQLKPTRKRHMTAEHRARIAEAQRQRWARLKAAAAK